MPSTTTAVATKLAPGNATKVTGQRLEKLDVISLKNLKEVELQFDAAPMTALMGANCSGKTTVLHALACVYRPLSHADPNYKFSQFFKPNSDSLWKGSDFTIYFSQRVGAVKQTSQPQRYFKADRWTPKYERRPVRFVRYLSIRESVPEVELMNLNAMVHYTKESLTSEVAEEVRETAGQVLNRGYDILYAVSYRHGKSKKSIAVRSGDLNYAALSMSSGEQRVFRILETVIGSPKSSLILIDEIDLFLHQDALERLFQALIPHCQKEQKQLIFTTHFPPVAQMYKDISVVTLHRFPSKTAKWYGYSYAALEHITGKHEKPLLLYVEDDVAEAIVGQVAREVEVRPHVTISAYGAAANAFSLGGGLLISGQNLDRTLIVLDGDVLGTGADRISEAKKVITGTELSRKEQRKSLRRLVRPLKPSGNRSPEQMLHLFLHSLNPEGMTSQEVELLSIAQSVISVQNTHDLISKIVEKTGELRPVALSRLVSLASKADGWARYTRLVRLWFNAKRASLNLDHE